MNEELEADDKPTHAESLALIDQVIRATRHEHNERGEGWLIWGWLLFLASALSFALPRIGAGHMVEWIWLSVLPAGFAVYFFSRWRSKRIDRVQTYATLLLNRIEAGFFISIGVVIAANYIIGYQHDGYRIYLFGYFFVLYAFWMFIHGSVIRFTPLILGAVVNWMAALVIFFLKDFQTVMLVSAIAVLLGYLIPGYLQQAHYRRTHPTLSAT